MNCQFCQGPLSKLYRMEQYQIVKCDRCHTSTLESMPDEDELAKFYNGFLFQANKANLANYMSEEIRIWLQGLNLPPDAKILDIGGGGGFMAKAVEELGFGEAYFIDLDQKACEFAKEQLEIRHVVHGNVYGLSEKIAERFDFIYSRHVIEHVLQPTRMLNEMISLLNPGGVAEVILPNGISREYLGHPKLLEPRINKILAANPSWSRSMVWSTFLGPGIAHGIDPIRHLWAISGKGIATYLKKFTEVEYVISSAFLNDRTYSMYHAKRLSKTGKDKLKTALINRTWGKLGGGCHLIVRIRKRN